RGRSQQGDRWVRQIQCRAITTIGNACGRRAGARWPLRAPPRPQHTLTQWLIVKYEAVFHGVPGRRIGAASLRKCALLHASPANDSREAVVSLDTTRLGIEPVVRVALSGELLPDGPGPRPHRRIFDRDFVGERRRPGPGPALDRMQV